MSTSIHTMDPATTGAQLGLCLALVGTAGGLAARRHKIPVSFYLWFSIACGSLALLTTDYLRALFAIFGAIFGMFHQRWRKTHPDDLLHVSTRSCRIFTVVGAACVIWILLYRLSSDFLPPLVWEATTILNYFEQIPIVDSLKAFVSRLGWAQGLLSEGDRSLLYGFPTLWLLTQKSSLVSLRIFSALYFLGAALCLTFFCTRFFNRSIATVAFFVFGLNELGLVFGRYGSSIASTLFALVLALLACASLVARPSARGAILAVFCLYIAPLGYASGRVVVLILTSMTLLGVAKNSLGQPSARVSTALVLCVGVFVVCAGQHHSGNFRSYAFVRGEEISSMFISGFWPEPMLDRWRSFKAEKRPANIIDYVSFGKALLTTTTIPQALALLSPFAQAPPAARRFFADPLRMELYAKPLYSILLIGLLTTSHYTSRWIHITLAMWFFLGCAPVLFTNRADSYRMSPLLIPLSVWLAVGVAEVLNELRRVRVPPLILASALLGIVFTLTAHRGASLHIREVSSSTTDLVIANLEPRFLNNAIIGVELQKFRSLALTKVLLLQRQQQGIAAPARLLHRHPYHLLVKDSPSEERTNLINEPSEHLKLNKPLILGPYKSMAPTLTEPSSRGFKVRRIHIQGNDLAIVLHE